MTKKTVIVVGAGIGGLTVGALLAKRGYSVLILDQAIVPGGCASTFKRKGFTFEVGATQVAGLEPNGIHHRIFTDLEIELPSATPCDPACAVYLPHEKVPINVYRDPQAWKIERNKQFPHSEPFWKLLHQLFIASYSFQLRDPVIPPRNLSDLLKLIKALRPDTLMTVGYTLFTVADLLRQFNLDHDRRLRTFLDLQLKLYSQVNAEETALLYAATALSIAQYPHGLYHLQPSMQILSDRLVASLTRDSGQLLMRHRVEKIVTHNGTATGVIIRNLTTNQSWIQSADHIVANLTVQNLTQLLDPNLPQMTGYRDRIHQLPPSSGAFIIYLGVDQSAIPQNCPPHLQFLYDYSNPISENNSLFVSVSQPSDGRAPQNKATIIASSFTDVKPWWHTKDYQTLKTQYTNQAISHLSNFFNLTPETILHIEAATPRTFAHFTQRDQGIVGGIGMRISTFGPFGFANRTPITNLWLVGDSTHPGEGTAGVSYSALTVANQISK